MKLAYFTLVVFAATVEADISFDGTSSSILFNNNAKLTTTCKSTAPPPPPLAPAVVRMKPTHIPLHQQDARVLLRLEDVKLSCAGARLSQPCVLPFDELDEIETSLRQAYEDRMNELEETISASGQIKKQLQQEVAQLTTQLRDESAARARFAPARTDSVRYLDFLAVQEEYKAI